MNKVSIIIVGWNHGKHVLNCLKSIYLQPYKPVEVIYVDNASTDGSIDQIKQQFPATRLIENETNKGFCKANNQGISVAEGEYIFLLNPDTEIIENCIDQLIGYLKSNPHVGLCGPKMLLKEKPDTINSLGMTLDSKGKKYHIGLGSKNNESIQAGKVSFLSGAALFMRTSLPQKIGGLDERLFAYADDTEFSLRVWKHGLECHIVPMAAIYHLRNAGAKTSKKYQTLSRYLAIRNHFYPYWLYLPMVSLTHYLPYIVQYRLNFFIIGIKKSLLLRKHNPELRASINSVYLFFQAIILRRKYKLSYKTFLKIKK